MVKPIHDYIVAQLRPLAIPIDTVVEDPANARVHGDRNLEAIRDSIRLKGQDQPIVVRESDMMISKGHGRLAAMLAMGFSHIAAVVIDETRISAVERGLADNRSSDLAENDDLALAALFKELEAEGGECIGWNEDEIDGMLTELADAARDEVDADVPESLDTNDASEDVIPPLPREPNTKVGEVLQLGPHVLHCGDCMSVMAGLADNSIDSIVTDPPYGLSPDGRARTWDDIEELRKQGKGPKAGFMGREWDVAVPGVTWARECLRVLKPGGFLVAASSTRTYHRLACAVEDAGFEIRDMIDWITWQGMPKSLDIAKSIDKQKDSRAEVLEVTAWIRKTRTAAGLTNKDIDAAFGLAGMAGHWTSIKSQPAVPTLEHVPRLFEVLKVVEPPARISDLLFELNAEKGKPGPNWWKREVQGTYANPSGVAKWRSKLTNSTAKVVLDKRDIPSTPEAAQWLGWGTALKPCKEPFVLARKPLEGTVVQNIAKWGVGGLNIDACRMAYGDPAWLGPNEELNMTVEDNSCEISGAGSGKGAEVYGLRGGFRNASSSRGRWPGNIYYCPKPARGEKEDGCAEDMVAHATVKPVKLIRWLLRLVTPPGGRVLEPFSGSGTAFVAAHGLDLALVGAELDPAFCDLARARYEGTA